MVTSKEFIAITRDYYISIMLLTKRVQDLEDKYNEQAKETKERTA